MWDVIFIFITEPKIYTGSDTEMVKKQVFSGVYDSFETLVFDPLIFSLI